MAQALVLFDGESEGFPDLRAELSRARIGEPGDRTRWVLMASDLLGDDALAGVLGHPLDDPAAATDADLDRLVEWTYVAAKTWTYDAATGRWRPADGGAGPR